MKKLLATSIIASMLVNPLSVLATESTVQQEFSITEQLLEELTSQEAISGEITSQESVSEDSLDDIFNLRQSMMTLDEVLAIEFADEFLDEEFADELLDEEAADDYSVALDATNFPSENLRNTLADYDSDEDGILSSSEINNIRYIILTSVEENIDLTGSQLLNKLNSVYIKDTTIDDLVVTLPNGISLGVSNSKINNLKIQSTEENATLEGVSLSNEAEIGILDISDYDEIWCLYIWSDAIVTDSIKLDEESKVFNLLIEDELLVDLHLPMPQELLSLWILGESVKEYDFSMYTGLLSLNISDTALTSIDVSTMTELQDLSMIGTSIVTIDTTNLVNLNTFVLYDSNVSKLDITKNTKLEYLEFSNTNITDIDLSKNIALERLYFSETNLTSIDLSKNINLNKIQATETRVKSFDLSSCPIDYVAVSSTYLEEVIISEDNEGEAYIIDAGVVSIYWKKGAEALTTSLLGKNDTLDLPSTVTGISYNTFKGNNVPTVLEIPETVDSMVIYGSIVTNSNSLYTLVLPDSLSKIYNILPVRNCVNLSNVYYRGDAPVSEQYNYETGEIIGFAVNEDYFKDLTLNVYYPKGNDTWNDVVGNNYGGKITWIEWDGTSEVGTNVDFVAPYIPESVTLDVEAEVKDEVAYATVDDDKLRDLILAAVEASLDGVNVEVAVTTDGIYKSVELTLDEASIGDLTGQNVQIFSILSEIVNMTFDYNALLAIKNATSGAVTFKATWVDVSTLSAQAQALFGDRPVMDFVVVDENGTQVEDFQNGTVTIAIPYTLQNGEVGSDLSVYYVNPTGTLDKMSTQYSAADKNVIFSTNHFSTYGVGNDNVSDDNVSDDNVSDDNVSDDNVSDDNASDDNASDDNASDDNVSNDNASDDNVSNDNASDDNASNDLSDTPKTGDNTTIWVLIIMLFASMVGMVVLLKKSRDEFPIE